MLHTFSEIQYNSNDAPVEERLTIAPVTNFDVVADSGKGLAHDILSIRRDAWAGAGWYAEALGSEEAAQERAQQLFDPENPVRLNPLRSQLVQAADGGRQAILLAKQVDHGGGAGSIVGVNELLDDVSGPNTLVRGLKRALRPSKVYGCTKNLNVRPGFQSHNVGTALFYAGMLRFRPEQKPTVYVADTNRALLTRLGELGFGATGSRPRPDLYGSSETEEVRLQAKSAHDVIQEMLEWDSWLGQGVVTR
jgi:hypothetical protein